MLTAEARRAISAATSAAGAMGLVVDGVVVLSDSNRLVVRLLPCDIVARITPRAHPWSPVREVELARLIALADGPIATLDPRVEQRVHLSDDFGVSFWTAYEARSPPLLSAHGFADALARLHASMRRVEHPAPHVLDRIAATQLAAADHDLTPDLAEADRALLSSALLGVIGPLSRRSAHDQLLHGEPHPGNVLDTGRGPLFVDLENAARGPIEYDLAWVPEDVSARYRDVDHALLDRCRGAVLAIIATHRWRGDDLHPGGRRSGVAFLDAVRDGPPWPSLDRV